MNLSLSTETREDGVTVVAVSGECDVYSASHLRQVLQDAVAEGRDRIALDMSGCEFLDYHGLGVIVGGLKRCREHDGSLAIAGAGEYVAKVFRITGLTRVLGMHSTVDEAVAALLEGAQ